MALFRERREASRTALFVAVFWSGRGDEGERAKEPRARTKMDDHENVSVPITVPLSEATSEADRQSVLKNPGFLVGVAGFEPATPSSRTS